MAQQKRDGMAVRRRRVAVGETIEMVISEDKALSNGFISKVGGQVHRVRILDGRVQIIDPYGDGPWPLYYQPTFELVGVERTQRGLWVDPIPRNLVQVFRYGIYPVSVYMTRSIHAVEWLDRAAPCGLIRALAEEGYQICDVRYQERDCREPLFEPSAAWSAWQKERVNDKTGAV